MILKRYINLYDHESIKIHKSSGIHESLEMYDCQNIQFAWSHCTVVYSHDLTTYRRGFKPLSVAKVESLFRLPDHVGCKTKEKSSEKIKL